MSELTTIVQSPLVIMFREMEGNVITHLYPPSDYDHSTYGLLVCDLVRHIAECFNVNEDDVWEWVDKERHHHTTAITRSS